MQSEILAHREEQSFSKELHEGGDQEFATYGHDASKNMVRVHALGLASTERLKLKRQMAAAAGFFEHDLTVFVHGTIWSASGGGTFYIGHPVLGRRSLDGEMVP